MSNLVFVLTLGDPLSSNLDLGSDKTFHHVVAVQSKQEGNFLSLCASNSLTQVSQNTSATYEELLKYVVIST